MPPKFENDPKSSNPPLDFPPLAENLLLLLLGVELKVLFPKLPKSSNPEVALLGYEVVFDKVLPPKLPKFPNPPSLKPDFLGAVFPPPNPKSEKGSLLLFDYPKPALIDFVEGYVLKSDKELLLPTVSKLYLVLPLLVTLRFSFWMMLKMMLMLVYENSGIVFLFASNSL